MVSIDELYEQAWVYSEKAEKLFARRDELKQQAKERKKEIQPAIDELESEIDELRAEADQLAVEFKELYDQSHETYNDGDGALAKDLAAEGHEKQDECEEINAQVSALY